jgi:uncharacterized protein YbaR (Trm112 family)
MMKKVSMPDEVRVCPHCKEASLNYYREANSGSGDMYYCSSCYGLAMWDGENVTSLQGEAYPHRDKSKS